ncbi:MAG: phosphonate metabolism protein/1,5-bisphosphokinase (PRPP-forming) PhnN [Hyphomicrobiales bacterium]|nr:MAG: phosphonate metabolism protein/1,5-bisphosphokinase (PRPP-forming) PhnN [Hyphomicrobiales bacterium]
MSGETKAGTLFLVAGPSGAGKDSLLGRAAAALRHEPRFHFPRRSITRPQAAEDEPHISISEAEFTRLERQNRFALSWRAHGLAYGVPASITGLLADGQHVIVNVSRGVIIEARQRYGPVHVIYVSASQAALRQRLVRRGRESAADREARIARALAYPLPGPPISVIDNSGALEDAAEHFLRVLRKAP